MSEKDKYYISPRTKRFVFIWTFLLVLIIYIPRILEQTNSSEPRIISFRDKDLNKKILSKNLRTYRQGGFKRKSKYRIPSAKFNPNDYEASEWMKLGLSEKQANVVMKFTSKGVDSYDDLQRIFVLSPEFLNNIKDSLVFTPKSPTYSANYSERKDQKLVQINRADEAQLEELPGIGEYLSKKIIEYRERLGGFHSIEQLKEIKYVEDKLPSFVSRLDLNMNDINTMNINTIDVKTLQNHPYLDYKKANSIIKLRLHLGQFKSLEDIKQSLLIDDLTFEKIKPYLSL